jgi:uncharacterized protein (TIGR00730 family)
MLKNLEESRYIEEFLNNIPRGVTVFGSARETEGSLYYKNAYLLGKRLGENGISVITGGGPGIMEAANRGAFDANGISVGVNITLPYEQEGNLFTTNYIIVDSFSLRKHMFVSLSAAYAVLPGGFGTLDEFAEIITLVQTGKIPPAPIALCGGSFWKDLLIWFNQLKKCKYISPEDTNIFTIMEDPCETADWLTAEILSHKNNSFAQIR